jgi:uroporphyrinogen decarboxylase
VLAPRYSPRLAFFGNIDVMVLATNDRAQIEREVRAKLAAGMSTRGYMFHSDHSVPPGVSWASYQFVLDLLEKLGSYA